MEMTKVSKEGGNDLYTTYILVALTPCTVPMSLRG